MRFASSKTFQCIYLWKVNELFWYMIFMQILCIYIVLLFYMLLLLISIFQDIFYEFWTILFNRIEKSNLLLGLTIIERHFIHLWGLTLRVTKAQHSLVYFLVIIIHLIILNLYNILTLWVTANFKKRKW